MAMIIARMAIMYCHYYLPYMAISIAIYGPQHCHLWPLFITLLFCHLWPLCIAMHGQYVLPFSMAIIAISIAI